MWLAKGGFWDGDLCLNWNMPEGEIVLIAEGERGLIGGKGSSRPGKWKVGCAEPAIASGGAPRFYFAHQA